MTRPSDPVSEPTALDDKTILDCLAAVAGIAWRDGIRIQATSVRLPDDEPGLYRSGVQVGGCGLGGAFHEDLREGLSDYFRSLHRLAEFDDYFQTYADLLAPLLAGDSDRTPK